MKTLIKVAVLSTLFCSCLLASAQASGSNGSPVGVVEIFSSYYAIPIENQTPEAVCLQVLSIYNERIKHVSHIQWTGVLEQNQSFKIESVPNPDGTFSRSYRCRVRVESAVRAMASR